MIKTNRKVFKVIYLNCKNGKSTSTLNVMIALAGHMPDYAIQESILDLHRLGYVRYNKKIIENNIRLTYKGEHYNEFRRLEIWHLLRNSILVPIIVSFITALLVEIFIK